jgi:ADP-ribosylglycohydrolase
MVTYQKAKIQSPIVGMKSKCLIGLAIGDAMGEPFEGLSRSQIMAFGGVRGFFHEPKITDDTLLSILVAESIVEQGGVCGRGIARKFVLNRDKLIRLGPTTTHALMKLEDDINYVSRRGTTDGAAMRAAPIGLACVDDIVDKTVEASQITHGTDVAISGACSISCAVDAAVRSMRKDDIINACIEGATCGRGYGVKTELPRVDEMIELALGTSVERLPEEIGVSMEAHEAVPCAIVVFYTSKNFKDAVITAVNLGGDTDTIAAMTGAISGAFYGDVPKEWINGMREGERLEYLEVKLLEMKHRI